MNQNSNGYEPNVFTIKKGPVRWVINSKSPPSCATSLIVPTLNIRKSLLGEISLNLYRERKDRSIQLQYGYV